MCIYRAILHIYYIYILPLYIYIVYIHQNSVCNSTLLSTPCIEVKPEPQSVTDHASFFVWYVQRNNQNSGLPRTCAYWVPAYNAWCCTGCLLRNVEPALVRGLHYQHTLLYMCDDVLPLLSYIVDTRLNGFTHTHTHNLAHAHTNTHTHTHTHSLFAGDCWLTRVPRLRATAHSV